MANNLILAISFGFKLNSNFNPWWICTPLQRRSCLSVTREICKREETKLGVNGKKSRKGEKFNNEGICAKEARCGEKRCEKGVKMLKRREICRFEEM